MGTSPVLTGSRRTAIAENHTHSFDRDRLTYSHYDSIRIKAFLATCMGVIYIDLAILRKNAGNFRQYGKSKRTAIAENHTNSFDRERLTNYQQSSLRIRA